ncbi:MAG: PHP domain-containing protein [Succiniclasticum sp.]|jgi:predicted metal-dependent phosphoesterase TrpH
MSTPLTQDSLVDLHMHSSFSDGIWAPEQLAAQAARAGIAGLALTDHDTLRGLPPMAAASEALGIRFVPGVELSTRLEGRQVHILGLGIRADCAALETRLAEVRNARLIRLEKILAKLRALGVQITVDPPKDGTRAVGRPHVARAMVAAGYVRDVQEAFDLYLGEGKPAYEPQPKMNPDEGVALVHEAGGLAIQAHPEEVGDRALVQHLLDTLPYDGVEVYHPTADTAAQAYWLQEAEKRSLLVSGGSDFHGNAGRFPEQLGLWKVPARKVEAVIRHFGWL